MMIRVDTSDCNTIESKQENLVDCCFILKQRCDGYFASSKKEKA